MEIISRQEAKAQGLKHYFTGKACKYGHVDKRLTSKGICMSCNRAHNRDLQEAGYHRDYYAKRMESDESFRQAKRDDAKRHYHNVMKHDEERMTRHYANTTEWAKQNRETCNKARRAFNARNPGYGREHVVARRAKIHHTDLTAAQQAQVKAIYRLRAVITEMTGVMHHVDHHIPLAKGGLHTPENLWIIPAIDNQRKGAKMPAA